MCVCVCESTYIYIYNDIFYHLSKYFFVVVFFLLEIAIDFVLRKRILDLGSVWTFLLHVDIYVAVHY